MQQTKVCEHEEKTNTKREYSNMACAAQVPDVSFCAPAKIFTTLPGIFCALVFCIVLLATLCACTSQPAPTTTSQPTENETPTTSGNAPGSFTPQFRSAEFSKNAAESDGVNFIDLSHVEEGYIGAAAENENRLKLQVACGDMSYNYDLPGTGEPIIVPVNMEGGSYTVRIMQNTTADRYVELFTAQTNITLADEFAPYVRPNVFCNYTKDSACVQLANELCAGAENESAAFDAIYDYISTSIAYDHNKADQLASVTGYVPNPDETLATASGICFDYASLTAAMLRSQGIPTKILTGYVSPDNIYHAWDMIYINGSWVSLHISAQPGQWARADMTFAANGAGETIGDASAYADRYTY